MLIVIFDYTKNSMHSFWISIIVLGIIIALCILALVVKCVIHYCKITGQLPVNNTQANILPANNISANNNPVNNAQVKKLVSNKKTRRLQRKSQPKIKSRNVNNQNVNQNVNQHVNQNVNQNVNYPAHIGLIQTILSYYGTNIQNVNDSSYEYTNKIIGNTPENKLLPLSLLDESIATDVCVICQDYIRWKSKPVVQLSCSHYIHYSCCQPLIDDFMQQNLVKYVFNEPISDIELFSIRCPICRSINSSIENVYVDYLHIEDSQSDSDEDDIIDNQKRYSLIYTLV